MTLTAAWETPLLGDRHVHSSRAGRLRALLESSRRDERSMTRPAAVPGPIHPVFTETSAASVDPLAYDVATEPDPSAPSRVPGAVDGEDPVTVMELVDDDPEHRWARPPEFDEIATEDWDGTS